MISLVGVTGSFFVGVFGLRSCLSKGILTLAGVAGLRSCCLSKVAILGSPERSDAKEGAACGTATPCTDATAGALILALGCLKGRDTQLALRCMLVCQFL